MYQYTIKGPDFSYIFETESPYLEVALVHAEIAALSRRLSRLDVKTFYKNELIEADPKKYKIRHCKKVWNTLNRNPKAYTSKRLTPISKIF